MTFQVPTYIRTLAPYVPGKPIEETQRQYKIKKVIKLASNENPLGPSPVAIRAVRSQIPNLNRYPDGSGFKLKQNLAKHLKVQSNALILGNGSNEVIDQLIRTYCIPGDLIATHQAAFIAYKICAQVHGVGTLEVPLNSALRFNSEDLVRLIEQNERVKLVFIANPNNPTGQYLNRQEMLLLLRRLSVIRGGSVLVVLDYAYWEYVTVDDMADPMECLSEFSNVVVLRTFSKIYGLAGLRVGYGIAIPEIISHLEKVRQPFNLNSLALVAAEYALSDRAFVKKSRESNDRGMKVWEKALSRMGIPYWKSQGNFILVDVQSLTGKTALEIHEQCLKAGIIFRPIHNYGLPHALRVTIGTPSENRLAIAGLEKVLGFQGSRSEKRTASRRK